MTFDEFWDEHSYLSRDHAEAVYQEFSALRAQLEEKNKALAEAERWFREYAELHSAKGNRDKAIRNMDRATIMHAALAATGKE